MSFEEIRDRFLRAHLSYWPSEASTLGLHEHDALLADRSDEAIAAELDLHTRTLRELSGLSPSTLDAEERLDSLMMTAFSRFQVHTLGETQAHLSNLEMSLHPYLMLQLQQRLSHEPKHWLDLSERVRQIPRFLEQQRALLERGVGAGLTPDLEATVFVAEQQIPHIVTFFAGFTEHAQRAGARLDGRASSGFEERCRAAAQAYTEHANFLSEEVRPASETRILGEAEYAWRLEVTLGVDASPSALIELGESTLESLGEELRATAARVHGSRSMSTEQALALVMEQKETRLAERDRDVIPAYRSLLERAERSMRDANLFHMRDELASLGLVPPPAAFTEIGAVTNVAAPLLDERGSAYFLIQERAEAHPQVQAALLAVHEGIPGHSLQSIWWQMNRGRRAHPVRFLAVPDDVAMGRQYFGAMMNIEGWATYAEALMREHGFFTPSEALWAIWAQMVHAARVVVDAGIHTGRMSLEEGEAYLEKQLGLPRSWAQGEVLRYRRIPLQALCYMLGRLEIMELRQACRAEEGDAFSLPDFHERLFAAGPVPAGHLKRAWL